MAAADTTADDGAPTPRAASRTASTVILAVVAGLLMAVAAMAVVLSRPSAYTSQATMLIDQPRAIAASGSEGLVVKLSRLRVKYADLVSADVVVDPVSQEIGIRPADIRRETAAFVPPQTLTVVVASRSGDAERARTLAQAVATRLSEFTDLEQEGLGIPTDQRVTLTVIDEAGRGNKVTPTVGRAMTVGLVAFLVTALAVGFGLPLLRDRRS